VLDRASFDRLTTGSGRGFLLAAGVLEVVGLLGLLAARRTPPEPRLLDRLGPEPVDDAALPAPRPTGRSRVVSTSVAALVAGALFAAERAPLAGGVAGLVLFGGVLTPELLAELDWFVRALVQSDRLGAPVADTLLSQAEELRTARRLTVEERAMRLPVTILAPTVLCTLPALLLVVLGPTVASITDTIGG